MTLRKKLTFDKVSARAYARLASGVALEIENAMREAQVGRSELARRSGMDKAALTRALDGSRNLEIRTIAALLGSLGYVMDVRSKPFAAPAGQKSNDRSGDARTSVEVRIMPPRPKQIDDRGDIRSSDGAKILSTTTRVAA